MEGMEQFLDFSDAIAGDPRIGTRHIALYCALLYAYIKSPSPSVVIDRPCIMSRAKMCRRTYQKCIKDLQAYGYIRYRPSYDPCIKSQVYLNNL